MTRRIVTLTGVGGVGKTRLGVHAAAAALPEFADGCWFVGLAAISDLEGLGEHLASTLLVPQVPGVDHLEVCLRGLETKSALLVLDNCEHILDEAADLCEEILDRCPGVNIVATSREGLGIDGEQIFAVRSLSVGGDREFPSEAVALFIERGQALEAGFAATPDDLEAIQAICERLDGIPLAIELAAARLPTLAPAEILDHLEDRFALLTGGRRRARGRHQALRSTIDWSYNLLTEPQQAGFRRLTVFATSFDFHAALAVTATKTSAEVVDLLDDLVNKSLLETERTDTGTRYRFLETIRQFGEQLLEESGEVASAMVAISDHFTQWASVAADGLLSADEAAWIERVEREVPNVRRIVDWSVDGQDASVALEVLAPFHRCLYSTPFLRGLAWSVWKAFQDTDLRVACEAFTLAAEVLFVQDDEMIELIFDRVTEIASIHDVAMPSPLLNIVAQARGGRDGAQGHDLAQRALAASRQAGDAIWNVHNITGVVVWGLSAGNISTEEAQDLAETAVEIAAEVGNPTTTATASFTYAFARRDTDPELSFQHFEQTARLSKQGGVVHGAGLALATQLAVSLGQPQRAAELLGPAMDGWITYHQTVFLDLAIAVGAALAAEVGDDSAAWALLSAAEELPRVRVLFPELAQLTREHLANPPTNARTPTYDEAVEIAHQVVDRQILTDHDGT